MKPSPLRQRLHLMLVPAANLVIPLLKPRLEISRPLVADCQALLERLRSPDVAAGAQGVHLLVTQLEENRLAFAQLKERVKAYVAVDEEAIAVARSLLDAMPITYRVPHLLPVDELLRDCYVGFESSYASADAHVDLHRLENLFGIVNAHDRILRSLAQVLSNAVQLAEIDAVSRHQIDF